MAELKAIALADIHVPTDRVRKIDDNKARVIGQTIVAGGLIHPVTVYRTPNGARPYTLAVGATRYRAHELHGLTEIECLVRKLDKAGARRIEIEENLFRVDLTMLERAQHVVEYRRLWEEENGSIRRGNPALSNSANLAELGAEGGHAQFYEQALDDFGLSRRAIERAHAIGKAMQPALQAALRSQPEANNQQTLERLARLEPQRQRLIAKALDQGHDVTAAVEYTDPHGQVKAKRTVAQKRKDAVVGNFHALGTKDRREMLRDLMARYPKEAAWALGAIKDGDAA